MTIDDENSIYVGGLPYSITEDTIRRVFNLYGAIVAVKIVNDHGTRGKCYGFVTFRNPRSVVDAISDMDGKTIDGRVVRVNAVTTRAGRSNFGRERFRQNAVGWDRGRERERQRYRERYSDRSRERDRSWNPDDDDRGRGYEHIRDHDRAMDSFVDGEQRMDGVLDREQGRDGDGANDVLEEGRKGNWDWEREQDLEQGRDRELDGTTDDQKVVDKETARHARKQNGHAQKKERNKEFFCPINPQYFSRYLVAKNFLADQDLKLSCQSLSVFGAFLLNDRATKSVLETILNEANMQSSTHNDRRGREISSDSSDDYNVEVKEKLERSVRRQDELKKEICQLEDEVKDQQQRVSDLQKKAKKLEDALINERKISSQKRMQLSKLQKYFVHTKEYMDELKRCEQEFECLIDSPMIEDDMGDDVGIKDGVLTNCST